MAVHHGNAAVVHEHRKCSDTHVHGKESVDIIDFHVFNTTGIAQVPCIVSCACYTNSTNVRLVISSPVAPAPFLPHDPSGLLLSCTASKCTRQMPKNGKMFCTPTPQAGCHCNLFSIPEWSPHVMHCGITNTSVMPGAMYTVWPIFKQHTS